MIAVAGLSVAVTDERSNYFQRGTWRDSAIAVGKVLTLAAPLAIPMAFASPVIILVFLRRWANGDWRYGIAAAAELAIAYANWCALLPAVQ
ncbi:MAG TPA: hypothetical protein VFV87_16450 [Pirellulaceae bacterium]|nr:hypothetical protein [Pirellulaceae bacterium]